MCVRECVCMLVCFNYASVFLLLQQEAEEEEEQQQAGGAPPHVRRLSLSHKSFCSFSVLMPRTADNAAANLFFLRPKKKRQKQTKTTTN